MATEGKRPVRPSGSSQNGHTQRPSGASRRPVDDERRPRPRTVSDDRPARRPQSGERRNPERAPKPRPEYDERRPKKSKSSSKAKHEKKKSSTGKIILIVIEVLLLAVLAVGLYFVLNTTKSGKVNLPEEDIIINEEVKEKLEMVSTENGAEAAPVMSGYRNIALFGVDSREKALTKNTRSDTIMIASINLETGDIKLVSVFRDTYLNLSNDSYNKCNAAYAKGGPMQAINMLNMNLDMNITDFVTIGFDGLIDVIDALGGVTVNVTEAEISHLNNYQISMVGKTTDEINFTATAGVDYTPVTSAGTQTLNGLQATAYCRIRYVGNDFQRAERQRTVIKAIMDKAKQNPTKLAGIAESVFSKVYTSLDLKEIVELLGDVANYQIVDEGGFPIEDNRGGGNIGSKGSCVVPLTLYDNVIWLHEFLFDEKDYEPSSAVKTYSDKIVSDTAPYL